MQTKNRLGEISEAAFLLRCTQMGWVVAKPFVEKQHYDFIVDTGRNLVRVQVKSSEFPCSNYRYRVNLGRGARTTVPYTKADIDFFAIHVVRDDTWYILPVEAVGGRLGMTFPMLEYVAGSGREECHEDWEAMDQQRNGPEQVDRSAGQRPRRSWRKKPTFTIQACASEFETQPLRKEVVR